MTRWIIAIATWAFATAAVAAIAFFAVLALAGPHGGLLPRAAHTPMLALGWAAVIVVPLLAARRAWRECSRRGDGTAR